MPTHVEPTTHSTCAMTRSPRPSSLRRPACSLVVVSGTVNNDATTRQSSLVSGGQTASIEDQAHLFSTANARTGALRLTLVRERCGFSGMRTALGPPSSYGSSLGTQNRTSLTLIQRPTFSSTINCITAFDPHRGHLPCSLSLVTIEQSRHSNSSDG